MALPIYVGIYLGTSVTSLTGVAGGSPAAFEAVAGTTYAIAVTGPEGDVALELVLSTVRLVSPVNGARFIVGSPIRLTASTTRNDGSVGQMQFRDGSQSLGVVSKPPYVLVWTNAPLGGRSITAIFTDEKGRTRGSPPTSITVTPINDDFANRTVITGSDITVSSSLTGANSQPGERAIPGTSWDNSIWWSWTAPASGLATIWFSNAQYFGVYLGDSLSNLVPVITAWGPGTFAAVAGATYSIKAESWPEDLVLRLMLSTLQITSPTNGAQFTGGTNLEITVGSTVLDGTFQQVAYFENSVLLGVITNAPFSLVWSNVPSGQFAISAVATTTEGVAHGSPAISITVVPPNDYFSNRITLLGSSIAVSGSMAGATSEPGEPGYLPANGAQSVWYSWIAPKSGRFVLGVTSWGYPPAVAFYTADDLAHLSLVASNNSWAAMAFTAVAGTAYQIMVKKADEPGGPFTLSLQTLPSNDNFAQRIPITNLNAQVAANNLGATGNPVSRIARSATATRSGGRGWPLGQGAWLSTAPPPAFTPSSTFIREQAFPISTRFSPSRAVQVIASKICSLMSLRVSFIKLRWIGCGTPIGPWHSV